MNLAEPESDLSDRIYEAAFVPELWPDVLQSLCDVSNSASGSFIVFEDRAAPKFIATEKIRPVLETFDANNGWQNSSEVKLLFSMMPPAAFIYDRDYFPPEAIEGNRARLDLTEPLGIGGQVGSFITMPTGEIVLFSMDRWQATDRPSGHELLQLNRMRPHLARAGLVAARLRLQRMQTAVSTLQLLGLPAAVLTSNGRVLVSNELLEMQTAIFSPTAFEGMAIADKNANALFQAAVRSGPNGPPVRSVAVQGDEGRPACVLHVLPLYRFARDIFGSADVIVALTMVDAGGSPPSTSILATLFDLSPAEARLATSLAAGASLQAAATVSKVTAKTARTYLERIFAKTGTHRQSELISLLKNISPFS